MTHIKVGYYVHDIEIRNFSELNLVISRILGPRKIPPHLYRHGTAQSHLSATSAQTLHPTVQAAHLEREKSFVSDASFARQETRGSLTSIREEDQRKKSERSGSLAPNKPAISESLKAEVNYIKVDFNLSSFLPYNLYCISYAI